MGGGGGGYKQGVPLQLLPPSRQATLSSMVGLLLGMGWAAYILLLRLSTLWKYGWLSAANADILLAGLKARNCCGREGEGEEKEREGEGTVC